MNIRRFQPGEELALFEVYYSAIHLIAKTVIDTGLRLTTYLYARQTPKIKSTQTQ